MYYRLTILNIASGLLLIVTFGYTVINYSVLSRGEGWGLMAMIMLLLFALVGLFIDFFIQYFTRNRPRFKRTLIRNTLGLVILVGVYYAYRISEHSLRINVPENFKGTVAVVYHVPNAPRLPTDFLTLNSEIELPDDGIIFTSSKIRNNDISNTHFMSPNDTRISTTGSWNNLYSDDIPFDCNGTTVVIRISYLGTADGEHKINEKIKEVKVKLKTYCTNQ